MNRSSLLTFAIAGTLLLFSSCKKDILATLPTSKPTVPVVIPDTAVTTPLTIYKRTIIVGTGSGVVTIDGKTMSLQCNDLVKIKGGVYTGINIKNILSADGCPITIKNDGLVEIVGDFNQMNLFNLKNVTISGDGTAGIAKGFLFRDNTYRSIEILGTINQFTLQHMAFKNIGNYVVMYPNTTLYDGTDATVSKDLKFLNITCDNTAQFLGTGGDVENGKITGLIKNIEVAYLDFQNKADAAAIVYMGNVENYNIHHNRVNNVNTTNNNHNGIFSISGNGSFHDNYISNHQGNAIRAWGHTVGSTPKNIYIYNNIVVNSRKYSAFELQSFANRVVAGKTTYVNAVVFNNTAGNINLSQDWQGNMVDVYHLYGGKCDVYNNLGYNFQGTSTMAAQESSTIPNAFSNLLYKTYSLAGILNETTFKLAGSSPAKNTGVTTPFQITDYYGSIRSSKPSIGAVE
jgi:hypothetical protein